MPIQSLHHVSVVVEDLAAAVAFFTALGLALEGQTPVTGPAVDRLCGLDDVRADVAMLRTPDGHGRVELTRYHSPAPVGADSAGAPPNTLGLRTVMFAVDDLDAAVARLRPRGGALVGEVVQYGDTYRLCYLRGPAGIIVALAEALA